MKLFTITQTRLIVAEKALDLGTFELARQSVLDGVRPQLEREVEEEFARYAAEFEVDGRFSWPDGTLEFEDEGRWVTLSLSRKNNSQLYSLKTYVVVRAFLCWLSTVLRVERGERPTLLVYEDFGRISFNWKLDDVQGQALSQLRYDSRAEIELRPVFRKFASLARARLNLLELNVYEEAGDFIARFNSEQRTITLDEISRPDGIVVLAFYCWLVDSIANE